MRIGTPVTKNWVAAFVASIMTLAFTMTPVSASTALLRGATS